MGSVVKAKDKLKREEEEWNAGRYSSGISSAQTKAGLI